MSQLHPPAHMHWMLPNWLRGLFSSDAVNSYQLRRGLYQSMFAAAYARSTTWGLQPPRFEPAPVRYASAEGMASVQSMLDYGLADTREYLISAQRFGLTIMVKGMLEAVLRVRVAYTLGYVCQDGQRFCYTPIEGLEQMLRTGIAPGARVNLHAWLTLPSHEIVDPTFWAMIPALSNADEREARHLFLHPDEMRNRTYHPQWIGDGFARRTGILKEYESW